MKVIIKVKHFSIQPCGIYKEDGPFSAEVFWERCLKPQIKNIQVRKIVINFNGIRGYSSSWLYEIFATYVRGECSIAEREKLKLVCKDNSIINEVKEYLDPNCPDKSEI